MKSLEKKYLFLILVFLFICGTISSIVAFSRKEKEEQKELFIDSNIDTIIYGDDNTINIFNYGYLDNDFNTKYVSKILETRLQLGDYKFTLEEAMVLNNKICFYAEKYNISAKDGHIIVNVESDFKSTAYNKKGKAVGLTQITTPCLQEYNNINGTKYELEQMFDIDLNLEVGFWYYSRLMNHYSKYAEYGITLSTDEKALRDCYIAYNVGITEFKNVGRYGRNQLRNGIYPKNMYGAKKGEPYEPIARYFSIVESWS